MRHCRAVSPRSRRFAGGICTDGRLEDDPELAVVPTLKLVDERDVDDVLPVDPNELVREQARFQLRKGRFGRNRGKSGGCQRVAGYVCRLRFGPGHWLRALRRRSEISRATRGPRGILVLLTLGVRAEREPTY